MTISNNNEKNNKEKGYNNYKKRQQRNKKVLILALSTLAILIAILLLGKFIGAIGANEDKPAKEAEVSTEEPVKEEKGESSSVTFMATGDNLIHNTIYEQAATRAQNGGYDFTYAYKDIAPIIKDKDLVFVNQETPVATAIAEPSNYPLFNTPSETVTSLNNIGFNLFNLASNHSLDQGSEGMEATLDFMATVPNSINFGLYRNYADEHTPHLVEKNGIIFGLIGVTEMTNGMSLPSDSQLDVVYTSQTDKIKTMIEEAKAQADVVILSVHWGDENVQTASQKQKDMAQRFGDMGADLIIGHHPHVLQEIETITCADGRKVPVVYSLGNLISTMQNKANHVGGFFGCTINKDEDGAINIKDMSFTPVVNYFTSGYSNVHVIPFSSYTGDMAANHGLGLSIEDVNTILNNTVGTDLVAKANK